MKNCPICRAEAGDEARYCRSCYAVFADDATPVVRSAGKRGRALLLGLVVLAAAAGAWFYRIDIGLPAISRTEGATQPAGQDRAPVPARGQDDPAGMSSADAAGRRSSPKEQWGKPENRVAARSVSRSGQRCAISQAVHNGRDRIIYPVALDFSFEDPLGRRIGSSVRSVVEAILPAGEQRGFTFDLPCPKTFAQVMIKAPGEGMSVAGGGSPESAARLMAGKPMIDSRKLHLTITAPEDFALCPGLEPCQLMLHFNGSWTAAWFRRDPKNPRAIISSDPQLVGPIQRGWEAHVRLPLREGAENVTITNEALREPETFGGWSGFLRSIGTMMGMKEESS